MGAAMCRSWLHELESSTWYLLAGLPPGRRFLLLEAFIRDCRLTLGEQLAKLTAGRESPRT